jgi:hypothetical protein
MRIPSMDEASPLPRRAKCPGPHIRLRRGVAFALLAAAGGLGACGGSGGTGDRGTPRAVIPPTPARFTAGPVTPINVLALYTPPHTLLEAELSDHDADGIPDLAWEFATTYQDEPRIDIESMPGVGDGSFTSDYGGGSYESVVPPLLANGDVLGVDAEGFVMAVQTATGSITLRTFGFRIVGMGRFGVGGQRNTSGALAGLAVGDWNGDHIDDVVIAEAAGSRVVACLSLGEAGLDPTQATALPAGHVPAGLAAGDLDGDGDDDLVVGLGAGGYVVLTSLATGLFTPGPVVALGADRSFTDFVVADFDGDGRQDVGGVVAQPSVPNGLGVLFGNGNGTFEGLLHAPLAPPIGTTSLLHVHTGDFNGDGRADLAFVAPGLDRAVVALSDAAGGFVLATDADLSGGGNDTLSLGDVDSDGELDLLLGNATALTVRVLLNNLL